MCEIKEKLSMICKKLGGQEKQTEEVQNKDKRQKQNKIKSKIDLFLKNEKE